MDAADSAGRQEADADVPADGERAADGRRSEPTLRHRGGEIAWTDLTSLGARRRKAVELCPAEADADGSVDDADRRRDGSTRAYAPLRLARDLRAFPGREPVRHERRLEGDDGLPLSQSALDLSPDDDKAAHAPPPARWCGADPRGATLVPRRNWTRS